MLKYIGGSVDLGTRLAPRPRALLTLRGSLLSFLSFGLLFAQDRLQGPLDLTRTVQLGQAPARALARYDQGPVDAAFPIPYVTMLLRPSAVQQTVLDRLLVDQQDPSSPNYHRWLKPEQFADRFGLSNADASTLGAWLSSQGMKIHDVAHGREWITFSGSAGDIGRALHTEIHRYRIDGKDRFANATEVSIPAAFQGVVSGFVGLDDLYKTGPPPRAKLLNSFPSYTDARGNHFLAPGDFTTIYDIQPLYNAGIDGTGQSIAIVGTSDISPEDIEAFQVQFNLPVNAPIVVPYGTDPGIDPGAMVEADLDIEWSGAVAPHARIFYVNSISPFLGVLYAIDANIAPIISMSYGYCEAGSTPALEVLGQQANAEGITWMASSGDSGAAQCDAHGHYSQASKGLAVNLPASLPEVTAVGGTEFNEGSGNYWAATNGADMNSALSYIPEIAWNETTGGSPLLATGGGASIFFEKPLWQTGAGVPNDNARDVPDVALAAAAEHDPYVIKSSGNFYLVGGTSASTPAFAGMVALLAQYLRSKGIEKQAGLGNINPALYRLARTTPSAFHDITSGNNIVPCVQATPDCFEGSFGYTAGPGYDRVTGLGSVDLNNLVTHWKLGSPSSTTLTATPGTIGIDAGMVQLTATVTAKGGTPTGTVAFLGSQNPLGSAPVNSTGSTGTATLAVDASQLQLGTHSLTAVYSGDHTFDGSAGSVDVTVTSPASGAAIAPSIANAPVLQSVTDSTGLSWQAAIVLAEEAGVGATVTGLSVNGVSYKSQLATIFKTTTIPPHGTLSGTLGFASLPAPVTETFIFTGQDATGASWTAQTSAQFLGSMEVSPRIALSVTPSAIVQNPANTSCPWQQQITIQEQGGNYVALTNFAMGTLDLTASIPTIFGTVQLAPFHSLQGTYCRSNAQPPEAQIFDLAGITELRQQVQASATSTYQGPSAGTPTMSVSPASVTLTVPNSTSFGSSSVALNFSGAAPDWTFSISPSGPSTNWLNVVKTSANELVIHAAPGQLGKGVYTAMLMIQSTNAAPQFINVPITMLVGDTSQIKIGGLGNAATNDQAFAPGMLMSVYGSELAPPGTAQSAPSLPLPLNLSGVSATVNGLTAPLYYLSPGQLNVQVPYETSAGTAILGINNNGQVASFPFEVSAAAPGIFTDAGGALVPYSSAGAGSTLLIYITGAGDLNPGIPTGHTPSPQTPLADLPQALLPVTVTVGGKPAPVQFAGVTDGLVGVVQLNVVVPSNLSAGPQEVVVTVGGVAAPSASVTITQ
jgi:uncharacterized protein (TIGR03437 family)